MSGHSKWATTKYRKGAQDKARAKLFAKLIRQVEVASREGGGDLESNASLKAAVAKARDSSVPSDTIERAIKRGTGELEGVRYEAVSYEGYGPNGVAIIVECLTDNRNRTGSEIRTIFSRNGGSMAEPGAVNWQFERKGVVTFQSSLKEEELLGIILDFSAEDLVFEGENWKVTCEPSDLNTLKIGIEEAKLKIISTEFAMVPSQVISIGKESEIRKILKIIDSLEDNDDVQNVYDNADFDESVLNSIDEL